jgi:tRNA A37 threonylcarbamoyladenosine dehydratase
MTDFYQSAFQRLAMLIGEKGLARLAGARVAVFGLGAVGSFAVEGLARSGIGWFRLVDFDEIKVSNLNRQLFALTATLGRPKVDVATERVLQINPSAHVEGQNVFFCREEAKRLLLGPLDFVVDAIDSLNPKVALIEETVRRGLPVVSSMGAASRTDPTRVHLTDLFEVRGCPLARNLRKRFNKAEIAGKVTAIWSDETPISRNLEQNRHDELPPEEEEFRRGRVRQPLPSMIHLPAIFGMTAANHVVWSILRR